ncbi:bifunctional 2',3'-cyclic-nucleotide 2'-phosphodiesterase/3'-nucleotidase [Pseudorhodobacter sp. E13]|uniref:bifunctional 2',3'-cyclic-nucleotide 2'-phosphodiesterase/3'-nucleotidase n=1 Tax=Pseudorhodobacter sp. E13 TaxID=2487931 RepID=UPI0013151EF3|nr:bifunctional 2',3'-cyclic-nucleotide 2'-phosphodiesterase/3'-nucleotidase [Pseudorhodobacter sp. E13]
MRTPSSIAAKATAGQSHLRILQTTDLHAQVLPFDYYTDRQVEGTGLARTASLIAAARAEAQTCLLLDNGDFLQGSAMGDYIAYDRGLNMGDLHPIIAAMNTLGYDAATLGNHEFNYGIPFMMAAIGASNFPFVSANTLTKRGATVQEDERLLPPYVLLDRMVQDGTGKQSPIRIGVLGLLPPQIVTWDEAHLRDRIFSRDMVETAAALIPEMRQAGADIIVVLAHTGIGEAAHDIDMENAAIPLAQLPGIDALILGHTHLVFPSPYFEQTAGVDLAAGTIAGTPAVMAGFWGSHLGIIDLLLEQQDGRWRVAASRSEARPIALRDPETAARRPLVKSAQPVLRAVQGAHLATLNYMRSPVGETLKPIHSYFAMIHDCQSLQIVCHAQSAFVAERLKGTVWADLPLLAAAAPFKAGGRAGPDHFTDIPAGPLYQRSVADLYCFPNTICALHLRGHELVEWLERSASAFHRITPGQSDQPLLDEAFPSYNFDVIFGLTYEIDPSQPARYSADHRLIDSAARRVHNLCYNGKPLDLDAEFIVATNNYRSSTQSAFNSFIKTEAVLQASVTIRTIIYNYICRNGPLNLVPQPNWRLRTFPDTSYCFDCSPRALPLAAQLPGLTLEPMGSTPDGFVRFRISA